MANDCPNCGGELRKTGAATQGNTPEVSCESCWWKNTSRIGLDVPDQGQDLTRPEARRRWEA